MLCVRIFSGFFVYSTNFFKIIFFINTLQYVYVHTYDTVYLVPICTYLYRTCTGYKLSTRYSSSTRYILSKASKYYVRSVPGTWINRTELASLYKYKMLLPCAHTIHCMRLAGFDTPTRIIMSNNLTTTLKINYLQDPKGNAKMV